MKELCLTLPLAPNPAAYRTKGAATGAKTVVAAAAITSV